MLASFWITALLLVAASQETNQQRSDQVWRLKPSNEEEFKVVVQLFQDFPKLDFWIEPSKLDKPVDVRVTGVDIDFVENLLRRNRIQHDVMINNVSELIERHHLVKRDVDEETTIHNFKYEIYHPAEKIETWMDLVENEFEFVEKIQVGVTFQGRPINALLISKSGTRNTPTIYVDSLIHSREWIAGAASLFVFKEILTNSNYTWMRDELNWFFIPMINVDGYIHTWNEDRLWRKTMSEQASLRCVGTDSNRNFDDHWQDLQGSSIEPCSSTFRGPFASSESETRHIADFIKGNNDVIKAVVTVHSYAQVLLYPYNYELGQYPANNDEQNSTAAAMSEAMYKLYNTTYEFGPAAETLAVATGVTTDWSQAAADIDINYTVELRDTGEYGFLLPEDQIIPTGEELLAGIEVLARHIREKYTN